MTQLPTSSSLTTEEDEHVQLMISVSDGSLDQDKARAILRSCNGDINRAVNTVFEGPPPAMHDMMVEDRKRHNNTPGPSFSTPTEKETEISQEVIDLTTIEDPPDDDLARALKASLETPSAQTSFGPSERAPNPQWAMVPSNVETTNASQDDHDHHLSRAIEASLSSNLEESGQNEYEMISPTDIIRTDDRPVALRPLDPKCCYAALVIQALHAIKESREAIESLGFDSSDDNGIAALQQLFREIDFSGTTLLPCQGVLNHYIIDCPPWSSLRDRPGELSAQFITTLAMNIQNLLAEQFNTSIRIFQFSYGTIDQPLSDLSAEGEVYTVPVDSSPDNPSVPNDLMSRLTSFQLFENSMILELSSLVTFSIGPVIHPTSTDTRKRESFTFPKTIYLDRFLHRNLQLVKAKWLEQQDLTAEVARLEQKKQSITHFNNKDTLMDLKATLHYYECVADTSGDPERQTTNKNMRTKLGRILQRLETEIKDLDLKIAQLKEASTMIFDVPELKRYQYDLRAVISHNGLYGPKSVHSYLESGGKWWKTVDASVTEVSEETVLEDTSGTHLGAGPYILIYGCKNMPRQPEAPTVIPNATPQSHTTTGADNDVVMDSSPTAAPP